MPVLDGEVDALGLANLLAAMPEAHSAIIEWPGIMPRNGAKSARSMGMSLGIITSVVALALIPAHRTPPMQWKRSLGIGHDKEASRALATRMWPGHAPEFKRVKDADRAEAALLAHWWTTKHRGGLL
jgi:hypothetical protein